MSGESNGEIDEKYKDANRMLLRLRSQIAEKLEPQRSLSETLHNRESSETSLNNLMIEINVLSRKIDELNPLIAQLYATKKQFWMAYVCVARVLPRTAVVETL